jgi:hypothetical protein
MESLRPPDVVVRVLAKESPLFMATRPMRPALQVMPAGRAALVVAHPGHELRVHGWLERAKPVVFVLTDGSGRTGASRLAWTTRVLENAGARPGPVYGTLSDRDLYDAVLEHDYALFEHLARTLSDALLGFEVDYVVGDLDDGHNPSHDVCRFLIEAAIALVKRRGGSTLGNFDFVLVGRPDAWPGGAAGTVCLPCDDDSLERKLEAARGYLPLADEVATALAEVGQEGLRTEILRRRPLHTRPRAAARSRYYERHGADEVAAGHYPRVLRYREHVLPLEHRLAACGHAR